jgi:hypothetical protein
MDAMRGVDDSRIGASITPELVVRGSTGPVAVHA